MYNFLRLSALSEGVGPKSSNGNIAQKHLASGYIAISLFATHAAVAQSVPAASARRRPGLVTQPAGSLGFKAWTRSSRLPRSVTRTRCGRGVRAQPEAGPTSGGGCKQYVSMRCVQVWPGCQWDSLAGSESPASESLSPSRRDHRPTRKKASAERSLSICHASLAT